MDNYNEVLAGLEKEFDLIKLAPARVELEVKKRPLIQLYVPGDSVVSCFLSGNYWEQDVALEVTDSNALVNTYYFALASTFQKILVSGTGTPADCKGEYSAEGTGTTLNKIGGSYKIEKNAYSTYEITVGSHNKTSADLGSRWSSGGSIWQLVKIESATKLHFRQYLHNSSFPTATFGSPISHSAGATNTSSITYLASPNALGNTYSYFLYRNSDNAVMYTSNTSYYPDIESGDITFKSINGSGTITGYKSTIKCYMRYLLDVEYISNLQTYELPVDDIVANNRNYKRAIGYAIDQVTISSTTQVDPTEYGLSDNGQYWVMPYSIFGGVFYPVAKSTWGLSSLWFNFDLFDFILEQQGRKSYTLKENIFISDAIKVLLGALDNTIDHEATTDYSEFLYGEVNPIDYNRFRLIITQKSNVMAGELSQPAQKSPITLDYILTMLRDCFQLYWFIDSTKKFRIEHISWFKNGGSYSGTPEYLVDLTTLLDSKNKKALDTYTNKYSYDKQDLAERYEFGWMDDVTRGFEGYPIKINSKFVQRGKIETISISQFTSDIDYMLLNPEAISQDGFALFAAIFDDTNLFDIESVGNVLGAYVESATGNLVVNAGYNTTDYISVEGDTYYAMSYIRHIAWYNKDKVYISGINSNNNNNLSQKSPANAMFIRCAVSTSQWSAFEFIKGRTLNGIYKLPFVERNIDGADMQLQNGIMSWIYLHPNFWVHDLPSNDVTINESGYVFVQGIQRKKKQSIKFPSIDEPDPMKLIKTSMGDGQIEKISTNLSSRMNTVQLKYDTN